MCLSGIAVGTALSASISSVEMAPQARAHADTAPRTDPRRSAAQRWQPHRVSVWRTGRALISRPKRLESNKTQKNFASCPNIGLCRVH